MLSIRIEGALYSRDTTIAVGKFSPFAMATEAAGCALPIDLMRIRNSLLAILDSF